MSVLTREEEQKMWDLVAKLMKRGNLALKIANEAFDEANKLAAKLNEKPGPKLVVDNELKVTESETMETDQ